MNLSLFNYIYSLAGRAPALDRLIIFAADYLGWVMLGWTLFYFLFFRRSAVPFLAVPLVAWLASEGLQRLVAWPRPFAYLPEIVPLIGHVPAGSFPSSHTAFFFGLALVVCSFSRCWGGWYIAGALIIGLARVAAGVHWPADILGGAALAALISALSFWIISALTPRGQSL